MIGEYKKKIGVDRCLAHSGDEQQRYSLWCGLKKSDVWCCFDNPPIYSCEYLGPKALPK
jgi:hypothetical protein